MIRRVHIKGYKSLRDVEIELQPLTIVFGPNAAGKSNLFDALGLVSRIATSKTLREAFHQHRGAPLEAFYYADTGLEGLFKKKTAQFTIEVDIRLSEDVVKTVEDRVQQVREEVPGREDLAERPRRTVVERDLRYSVTIQIATDTGYLQVLSERLTALKADGTGEKRSRAAFISREGNKIRLRRERGAGRPTEYDVGLDYSLVSTPLYPPHYPHVSAFKEDLARWRFYYLEPGVMRKPTPIKVVDALGPEGADLAAFYNFLKSENPSSFNDINRALDQLVPTIRGLDVVRSNDGFLHLLIDEDGVFFSARVISEGTLRLLALLAITNSPTPPTVIGYEEPENGVHPRRLKLIADLLENAAIENRTQIIVNTHSPILPEYFDNDALFVCGKVGHETVIQKFTSDGLLFKAQEIRAAFDETPLSERILRGDFGG
jgi:predicted ATPase